MPAVTARPRPSGVHRNRSVGPEAVLSTYAMFPEVPVQPWDGWGVEWQVPAWDAIGGQSRLDQSSYMARVSTVMTAMDLNSRALASMPIYGAKDDFSRFALPSWSESPEPEVYSSWVDFMKACVNSLQACGEIILWSTATGSDGYPFRFVALDPAQVAVEISEGRRRYYLGPERVELNPMEVCYIPYQQLPGITRGISPLEWTGRSLMSAAALEVYSRNIAQHGTTQVLNHPDSLTPKQADNLRDNWMGKRAANPGSPAILSGGTTFETLTLSPKDLALLDIRVFDEQRIASSFGVPPFLIGLPQPGGFTYANANSLFDFHWRGTLKPIAQAFSSAVSRWTMPRGKNIEFNRDEYVQGDMGERASAYSTLAAIVDPVTGLPAMEVEEIRARERLQPTDPTQREQVL